MDKESKLVIAAVVAVSVAAAVMLVSFAANAEQKETTGRELVAMYASSSESDHTAANFYIMGIAQGLSISKTICAPPDQTREEVAMNAVRTLAQTEELHDLSASMAITATLVLIYPCGDPV